RGCAVHGLTHDRIALRGQQCPRHCAEARMVIHDQDGGGHCVHRATPLLTARYGLPHPLRRIPDTTNGAVQCVGVGLLEPLLDLICASGFSWVRSCCSCRDRKSTRLNSSHLVISYAVFCLKKKKNDLVSIYLQVSH